MTSFTNDPSSHMQAAFYGAPFEVLDGCHREILGMLHDLQRLLGRLGTDAPDPQARKMARDIHLFFSTTGLPHHLDEETHIFPRLQAQGDPETSRLIEHLRQDHLQIEAQWRGLVPHLDTMARGYRHSDLVAIRALVDRFVKLCRQHIALEESLIYPEAKARLQGQDLHVMRREMAARRSNLNTPDAADDLDPDDGDV